MTIPITKTSEPTRKTTFSFARSSAQHMGIERKRRQNNAMHIRRAFKDRKQDEGTFRCHHRLKLLSFLFHLRHRLESGAAPNGSGCRLFPSRFMARCWVGWGGRSRGRLCLSRCCSGQNPQSHRANPSPFSLVFLLLLSLMAALWRRLGARRASGGGRDLVAGEGGCSGTQDSRSSRLEIGR